MRSPKDSTSASRREFLKATGAVAGAAAATWTAPLVHAGEDNTIKVALVGCGGRGTGAAVNALATKGPIKLVAMADVFADRMDTSLDALKKAFPKQVDVPRDRQFLGFDAFKKAVDLLGPTDVVILATPAGFRPIHFEYAVAKGVNVFFEKSFAVDTPGVKRVMRAGEASVAKNLKVAGGLMWRHCLAREEAIRRIHDGQIGDVHTLRTYRMHGPVGCAPHRPGENELAYQIRNYNGFTWTNASFFVDWIIHNIDICCWAKGALPVAAQGQGGRQTRTEADQCWDHYMVEYLFSDGARLFVQGRHQDSSWGIFGDFVQGSKGSAVLMESLSTPKPRFYKGGVQTPPNETWRYAGPEPDPYQNEWDLLTAAIRRDHPYNESARCAKAVMVAILGRMAAHSGQMVTYEEAMSSTLEIAPGLDKITWQSEPPVKPDKQGRYPIAMPGLTKEI